MTWTDSGLHATLAYIPTSTAFALLNLDKLTMSPLLSRTSKSKSVSPTQTPKAKSRTKTLSNSCIFKWTTVESHLRPPKQAMQRSEIETLDLCVIKIYMHYMSKEYRKAYLSEYRPTIVSQEAAHNSFYHSSIDFTITNIKSNVQACGKRKRERQ